MQPGGSISLKRRRHPRFAWNGLLAEWQHQKKSGRKPTEVSPRSTSLDWPQTLRCQSAERHALARFAEALSEALAAELQPLSINVAVVEPVAAAPPFWTAARPSISRGTIADYDETPALARRTFAAGHGHEQRGDPAGLAKGMTRLARSANPPLRMPVGTDTVAVIELKNASVATDLAQWRELAVSTDSPKDSGSIPRSCVAETRKAGIPPGFSLFH